MAAKLDTPGDRLRAKRIEAGYRYASDAARAFKAHPQNWADRESGRRKIELRHAERYARWLKSFTPWWLLTGQDNTVAPTISLVGYVGAGEMVHYLGAQEVEHIDAPPGSVPGDIAFRLRGKSMGDFVDGGIVIVRTLTDISAGLFKKCVVDLIDGRRYFKRIVPSKEPGRYTLLSLTEGEQPIEDVEIESAARLRVYIEPD